MKTKEEIKQEIERLMNLKVYVLPYKITIPLKDVIKSLAKIYNLTKEESLINAIQEVKDFSKLNVQYSFAKKDAHFVEKLLLLDASGDVRPSINFGEVYGLITSYYKEKEKELINQDRGHLCLQK